MKNKLTLSAAALSMLCGVNVSAADSLSGMFSEGKTSGQIREYSISRAVDISTGGDYTRTANAIGGHLKYETADFEGFSMGTAFYTTNGFLNSEATTSKEFDPTLLGKDNRGYSILGEAYLQYKRGNTAFKAGRQKLNTPMAGADDARMLPNMFEAYVLSNTDLDNTTLIAAHVTEFAQGTFGRAYGAGGLLGATSGYSAVDASNQVGDFVNMGKYAVGESTAGVSVVAGIYKGENFKVQLWDYYAYDLMNIIYGQLDLNWKCVMNENVKPFISAQIIKEDSMGEEYAGEVDSMYGGAKVGAKVENFVAYAAYSQTTVRKAGEDTFNGAIVSPWGGMPAFTQGMVTRHQFLAGTKATKVAAAYNWKAFGPNLKTVLYWANYDMHKNNGYTYDDASETGFDVIYYPEMVKNLQLRLRGNFADDFKVTNTGTQVGWNEYRFIVNYNF